MIPSTILAMALGSVFNRCSDEKVPEGLFFDQYLLFNYLRDNGGNTINDSVEAKFRMGFEYSSSDGRSSLQFNLSLNTDDPVNDPGDGGGIGFQSVF